ncbi:MAG: hypothetical protein K9H25_16185 [Rhodospirillum sp.]|nr:hypothetical protein [Rhodospirillum sp.]MCF8500541.1 hypothetical protein [Rhodospirillum sp.]
MMSADIVGATAYKSERVGRAQGGVEAWLPPFYGLFRDLPLVFMGKLAQAFFEADRIPEVAVWRVAGDEVVFIGEPTSRLETLMLVEAFGNLTSDFHGRLGSGWGLGLRGCVWLAPLGRDNVEIEVPEITMGGGGDAAPFKEYLGPDVDSGFRLSKHGHPGEMILSPLLVASLLGPELDGRLAIRVEGAAPLKGLFGGEACPLLHGMVAKTGDSAALMPVLDHFSRALVEKGQHPLTPAQFPEREAV